jgi:glycosyltransferase involved in cell wall biosynthesis
MRLTLDLTPTLLRSAGVKNHLYYWSRALEATRSGWRMDYYPFANAPASLDHDSGVETGIPNWRLFLVAAMNAPALHPLAQALVPPSEILHGSPQLRLAPRTRFLTSHIHDLTCWLMPEFHTAANVKAAYQMADHVWKKADGLIAVSNSAKDDAVRLLGLRPELITVIPHGVPEAYFATTPDAIAAVKSKLALTKPYILNVGTVEPRKNVDRLLDAWLALPPDIQDAFDLVIAGPAGWKSESTLARLRREPVRYLGYVGEADLPALTAGATAHVYPSLYEGFGFPLAQAMACGVSSLTSGVSSMPEVSANSALLVDPRSVGEIRQALLSLLTSPGLRESLGQHGKAHASEHYRWESVAMASWRFFENVTAA